MKRLWDMWTPEIIRYRAILALARRRREAARFFRLNPCLFLAAAVAGLLAWPGPPAPPASPVDSSRTAEVSGLVASAPQRLEDRLRMEVRPLEVRQGGRLLDYPHRLLVAIRWGEGGDWPVAGEKVRFRSYLREPPFYATPGVPDYRKTLWLRGIRHVVRLKSPLQLRRGEAASGWMAAAHRHASAFQSHCRQTIGESPCALVAGVLLGRRPSGGERQRLERVGVLHLFVVSGFHVSLVAALLHFLASSSLHIAYRLSNIVLLRSRFALRKSHFALRIPHFALSPVPIVLAGVWTYVLLTGAGPATLRAGIMTTAFYLLFVAGLRRQPLNALGIAALAVMAARPAAVFSAGFQFSFLALLAIGVFFLPRRRIISQACLGLADARSPKLFVERDETLRWRRRVRFWAEQHTAFLDPAWTVPSLKALSRVARFAVPVGAVSLFVQIATLPLAVYYSNLWVWTQVPANFVLVPAVSLLMPLGLLWMLVWKLAWLDIPLAAISWAHARFCQALLDAAHDLSLSEFAAHPRAGEIAAYLLGLLLAQLVLRGWRRWAAFLAAVLILRVIVGIPDPSDGTLRITMLDVGQGEAIHIAYPDGRHGLVDTGGTLRFGPPPDPPTDDFIGRRVTARYLWHMRTGPLEYILLTHPHADHTGGYRFLHRWFSPKTTYHHDPPELPEGAAGGKLSAGDSFKIGEVDHHILHPPPEPGILRDANDRSLVVLLRWKDFEVLLTGDIERPAERLLADSWPQADILKIPHHGARASTGEALLNRTRPQAALISAGRNNPFGHPSPEVLSRLSERGISVFTTAEHGAVRVETNGYRRRVEKAH